MQITGSEVQVEFKLLGALNTRHVLLAQRLLIAPAVFHLLDSLVLLHSHQPLLVTSLSLLVHFPDLCHHHIPYCRHICEHAINLVFGSS